MVNRISKQELNLLFSKYPLINDLVATREVFWTNPNYKKSQDKDLPLSKSDIIDAANRLQRFAPYIQKVFPETEEMNGLIESPVIEIPTLKKKLETTYQTTLPGKWLLKCDSHLPISGSIKARGGIYEVLKHAEQLAIKNGMLTEGDNYSILANETFKKFFSQHKIAVGSTGNLGLSIGIMSAQLGFQVTVHMSEDAKEWKKQLLRSKGVKVVEYQSDFSMAVEEGRKQAEQDPLCYFIDDENSRDLLLGYSVAALRLEKQLVDQNIKVDDDHPLFVYLPCGVGGGPGGVTFGLKEVFGNHVHSFFGEPTHSPCMLLGMMTNLHENISVQDVGIDNKTEADGLAVGRPSGLVGPLMESLVSGCYTVNDSTLFLLLHELAITEKIYLEPSALAGVLGPIQLVKSKTGNAYLRDHDVLKKLKNATHLIWGTGGSMVPEEEMEVYFKKGIQQKNRDKQS